MSGQYPPPNPGHPFSRAPHHQRGPPSQSLLPPWGHSPQPSGMNVVGSSMNYYNSPHMALPSRAAQPWGPPQSHPKPLDTRPAPANPLFGLQMLMTPGASQRIPSEYQQEETMDLSSHSTTLQDIPKVSARTENNDLLRNGAILSPEVNGDVDRTEREVKDSIVTSVIATNPLRESVTDALNCSKVAENSVVRRVETTESLLTTVDSLANPQCVKNDSVVVDVSHSEPVNSVVSSVLKTPTSSIEPVVKSDSTGSDRLSNPSVSDVVEKMEEEKLEDVDTLNKSVGDVESVVTPNINESQSSCLDSSSLSVDTDDSKLDVAESSAEDIFGISPVDNTVPTSQETEKSGEPSESSSTITETVPDKTSETTPVSSVSNDQMPPQLSSTTAPSVRDSEPNPSVENVETLLESMFNTQVETCSLQNSNSGMPHSVIVSNGARTSSEIPRPQMDLHTPMKEDELAKTLAEDNPMETEVKEEINEGKGTDNIMDEIENKLEILTESSSNEQLKFKTDSAVKTDPPVLVPKPVKEEADSSKDKEEDVESVLLSIEPKQPEEDKTAISSVDSVVPSPKVVAGPSNNPFIEVETELEKMFAGIVETVDEVGSDNASHPLSSGSKRLVNKKSIAKRKKSNSRRPSDNSVFGGSSGDSTSTKKKSRKRVNDSESEKGSKKIKTDSAEMLKKGRVPKEMASSDSFNSKVKGPFIHIEGTKESPASVVVVNSGVRADDEDGLDKASARRKHSTLQRSEGALRKPGPAYSSSTLSMRYNSDTADLSWVCVFCKRGPHCTSGLGGEPAGDLFGPYRIPVTLPGDETMPPGTPADRDVVDEQKKRGGKYPKSLRVSGAADHFIQKMSKKGKRSLSSDSSDAQPGMLSVEGGYEVWLHGHCAEWASGLYIIGTQLVGLDDAVWTALRMSCSQCGDTGAGIGCVVRNCPARMHYHCAILCGWLLDIDTFIARCHVHRTRLRPL